MEFKFKMGTDMSKAWFDYCLLNDQFEVMSKSRVENNADAITKFIEELLSSNLVASIGEILLVIEHTGIYINHLVRTWIAKGGKVSLVHAAKVSEGLIGSKSFEEKTDELDAFRIAEYAIRFADKLKLHELSEASLTNLKLLRSQRSRMIKAINLLEVPLNEINGFESEENSKMLNEIQENSLFELQTAVKNINSKIKSIIDEDSNLKQLFKLICSVHGIGPVTAIEILISTNGFTDFSPNQAKSYARFCGVVPLPKSSGKTKRKPKTSKNANAKMKTLLTTSALSLINTKSDLGRYYDRLIEKGKAPRMVINAMRNKLILRVFAVVRNQAMYERNFDIC